MWIYPFLNYFEVAAAFMYPGVLLLGVGLYALFAFLTARRARWMSSCRSRPPDAHYAAIG